MDDESFQKFQAAAEAFKAAADAVALTVRELALFQLKLAAEHVGDLALGKKR